MIAISPPRAVIALGLLAALSACGSGPVPVRDGPQAVHPSPSALAQGAAFSAAPSHAHAGHAQHCAAHHGHACGYGGGVNDGSRPIID